MYELIQRTRLINRRLFSVQAQTSKKLSSIKSIKELHAQLIRTELHTDPSSISPVIRSYALSPYYLRKSHLVFDQIHRPTLLVYNHMIHGLSQSDQPENAIKMFNKMVLEGLLADNVTFLFIIKSCARLKDLFLGQMIHVHVFKLGFESYLYVSNALIHMYGSCGDLGFGRRVFDEMSEPDLVSWNSLICGYSQCNRFEEVLGLFDLMRDAAVKADAVTMVKVVLACVKLSKWDAVDSMVAYMEDNDVETDVYLGNTLIDMYRRRGLVEFGRKVFDRMQERNIVSWNTVIMGYVSSKNLVEGRRLFDEMSQKDVISWTSMITGYCQQKQFAEAVKLFRDMMLVKVKPDAITVTTVFSACAHLGLLDVGEAIHEYVKEHCLKQDVHMVNSLINMYCKCGATEKAMAMFLEMKMTDSVSWTSIISGMAVNGSAHAAISLFKQMLEEGIQPTHGSFLGVLLACCHGGLVPLGLEYFYKMQKDYGLIPEIKHYGCVVDLLSRSGELDRAYEFINRMPISPSVVVWRVLLSGCKLHGNLALAKMVTEKLHELDPSNSSDYVLLSNTYASSGRWDDAGRTRELMEEVRIIQKPSGWSSIEVNTVSKHDSRM